VSETESWFLDVFRIDLEGIISGSFDGLLGGISVYTYYTAYLGILEVKTVAVE